MNPFDRIMPAAFLACVALTACNGHEPDSYPTGGPAGPVDTIFQPDRMPAPANPAPDDGNRAQDSATTKPLATLTEKKESSGMPEALHGNNHSSPSVGPESGIKKSSMIGPRTPKVIWV